MAPGCKRRILSSKGKEGEMREPLIIDCFAGGGGASVKIDYHRSSTT